MNGFVLLLTVYNGSFPEVKPPAYYATQIECQIAEASIRERHTGKRNKRVSGGCYDLADPAIRAYLMQELQLRSR